MDPYAYELARGRFVVMIRYDDHGDPYEPRPDHVEDSITCTVCGTVTSTPAPCRWYTGLMHAPKTPEDYAGLDEALTFLHDHLRCGNEEVYLSNAMVALDRALMRLERTSEGKRNNQLNRTAYIEGRAAIAAGMNRGDVEAALYSAAIKAGLTHNETRSTIRSGLGW